MHWSKGGWQTTSVRCSEAPGQRSVGAPGGSGVTLLLSSGCSTPGPSCRGAFTATLRAVPSQPWLPPARPASLRFCSIGCGLSEGRDGVRTWLRPQDVVG